MNKLVWIDCEMTGLNPFTDHLLEIGVIVTTTDLNIIDQSSSYVIGHPLEILKKMDEWNTHHHTKSGLWNEVLKSQETVESIEEKILQFLSPHIEEGKSPLCGNSIHQDRFFLRKWMPRLESYFHYRNIDVSTLKQIFPMWDKQFTLFIKNETDHRAVDDIKQSIEEMRYYRKYILGLT
jgi:oligoribonuclease